MADPIYLSRVFIPRDTPIFLGDTVLKYKRNRYTGRIPFD
jgi:hypothetical protein